MIARPVEVAGPLGTPLGLAQRKRASLHLLFHPLPCVVDASSGASGETLWVWG